MIRTILASILAFLCIFTGTTLVMTIIGNFY
ncbi:hypothetical protein [Desulfofustis phage LS06-2018-MD01]|nr:hypothetical protein [Desulfofustis phage LS06-2018-MD01]